MLAQRAAERGQCRAAWGSGRAWRNVGRPVQAMHWPVPRGGDAELVTWPTVAWLLRRVSATNPNAALLLSSYHVNYNYMIRSEKKSLLYRGRVEQRTN